ncbi:MAG: ABC transporter substrate-binding protein [Alphaproteobacteria bacterium]|nr:ABC transporter substrate-binding protein [Alphaproteobacteria bacterium]
MTWHRSNRLAHGATVRSIASQGRAAIAATALFVAVFAALTIAGAVNTLSAAGSDPLKISVHVSSDGNRCYAPGLVAAVKYFTGSLADEVNRDGGIAGRQIELAYYDDYERAEKTIANVREAITDPATIAMLGLPSSTRGRAVFDTLGTDLRETAVPFVTEMSLDNIFRDWPNVFTMASSVRNELEVVQKMIATGGYQRPAFVGVDDDLYSFALEDGVAATPNAPPLAARLRVPVRDYQLSEAATRQTAKQLADANPDLIVLSIHSGPSAELLKELAALDVKAPVVVLLGRIATIMSRLGTATYAGPLSQIAREGVPNVFSERLRRRIWRAPKQKWVFPDVKLPQTDGWNDGRCKETSGPPRAIYDAGNSRAVGRGMQYRDVLALIIETARSAPEGISVADLRRHIGGRLRNFVEGRHVLKGVWRDLAFTTNRTAAEDTLLLTKNADDPAIVLSPVQYQRINGELIEATTLYTAIDLISLSHIETNDQSFDAEFYLSIKSAGNALGIEDIDFTNAARSQVLGGKLLNVREIHGGNERASFPTGVKLYKVSGKFLFEPELSRYPFDKQRFSISFQPTSTAKSFLIQPPAERQRITDLSVDGWRVLDQYVGADQDIIPTIGASLSERRIVPFYKFNATWVAQRISVDYYTRVVIPLGFILLVTYFSVYLPRARFDSAMGVQVTALLSSIALYLALPKIDTDQATLSDKIFMITYAAVAMMIGLSILKDNIKDSPRTVLRSTVTVLQRLVFPLAVALAMAGMITYGQLPGSAFLDEPLARLVGLIQI